ncbi:MAG: heavy metal translocating P-type ATPase, partial [Candidatus Eiseniibacteriota bacterium]
PLGRGRFMSTAQVLLPEAGVSTSSFEAGIRERSSAAREREALGLCAHCELPLPSRPVEREISGVRRSFCCAGCRTVFLLVGEHGGQSGWYLAKLALSAIFSGNIMMFQFLLYLGSTRELGADIVRTTSWLMLGMSLATYLLIGLPMLRSALSEMRRGRLGLDLLISAGSLIAILASMRETLRGGGHTYYDTATMILVLVTLGAYLDARARERATQALRSSVQGDRRPARLWRSGVEALVPPESVAAGERVSVRAGEEIPTDGRVLGGVSDVQEAAFSGEPLPRRVSGGDRVFAGSVALDGALEIESSGITETLAERVRRLAERARVRRPRIAILADRISAAFIPAVLIVALGTLLARGALAGDWGGGGLRALAVLVVACPCALGLATPLATTVALSGLAARGTLVRGGDALEKLARVRCALFDKTGTLTRGRPSIERSSVNDADLAAAAAVERGVSHPFAEAIVAEAARRGLPREEAVRVRALPGAGAEGWVDGAHVRVGSADWLASQGVATAPAGTLEGSSVWVATGARLAGEVRFSDPLRTEAGRTLASIRALGIWTVLLSGDREAAVQQAASAAGFDQVAAAMSPLDKTERVERERERWGAVAMVGDGLNDAAALGAADVGIAFGRAADLSREHADVSILREDLGEVLGLLMLARRTLATVRGNLLWAFAYNLVGVSLAAAGKLSPVVAAAAMVLSSLFVVWNSMRLGTVAAYMPSGTMSKSGSV